MSQITSFRSSSRIILIVISGLISALMAISTAECQEKTALQKTLERYQAGIRRSSRIFGNVDATIQDNAWQVALVATAIKEPDNADAQFCGGTIVAARWVVTAAHCVDVPTKDSEVQILVGTANLASGGHRVSLVEGGIHIHNPYNYVTHENDIALLETKEDLGQQKIPGWSKGDPEDEGQEVRITGWGALSWQKSPPMSIQLQAASPDPTIVSEKKCNAADSYDGGVKGSIMLCIGNYGTGKQDTCDRDSGGPATSVVNGTRKLIGITSFGAPKCGTPKMPGIYVRVSQFGKWVHDTSGGAINW